MPSIKTNRIESLDLLKGLVMVIMALDHTRDYFHESAFLFSPTDPVSTNGILFFTRWITHFCAPAFCLLAGISAYLVSRRKSKKELSIFLLSRGIWLVFIEATIMTFGWRFDVHFQFINLQVLWSLGISMIFLAGLIRLPMNYILGISLLIIFGHNLLDHFQYPDSFLWSMIHVKEIFHVSDAFSIQITYPIIPWVGVMSLGYYIGTFYAKTFEPARRKKLLNIIGFASLVLFIILRLINHYGNFNYRVTYDSIEPSLYSFLNPAKYPPSLTYLLMTLGLTFLFLGNSEKLKGKVVDFFSVYGKVPFFYYILHIYLIHFFALLLAQFSGWGWERMILHSRLQDADLPGFGINLGYTYLVWVVVVLILYPFCKTFSNYKLNHKEKWWLSYF